MPHIHPEEGRMRIGLVYDAWTSPQMNIYCFVLRIVDDVNYETAEVSPTAASALLARADPYTYGCRLRSRVTSCFSPRLTYIATSRAASKPTCWVHSGCSRHINVPS